MRWTWLPARDGFIAYGRENTYLIAADQSSGLVTGVRVNRWRTRPMSLSIALEASRNVIVFPLAAPRPAGDIEVAILLDAARSLAGEYESGTSFAAHPAWQHPPAPAAPGKGRP